MYYLSGVNWQKFGKISLSASVRLARQMEWSGFHRWKSYTIKQQEANIASPTVGKRKRLAHDFLRCKS